MDGRAPRPSTDPFYEAPPITEAAIEIKFKNSLDLSQLKKLSKKLAQNYPREVLQFSRSAQVDLQNRSVEFISEEPLLKRSMSDEATIIMLKPESFVFSRLAPYPGWDKFFPELSSSLAILLKGTKRAVERICIRYINRIDIPANGELAAPKDYLNIYVHLPALIGSVSDYNVKFESPYKEYTLIVHSGRLVVPTVVDTCAFYLDIDLIALEQLPQDFDGILDRLTEMRQVKNEVFESFVKPPARDLFNHA